MPLFCHSILVILWTYLHFFSPFPLTEILQEKNFTLHFTLPSFFQVCCLMQLSFEGKSVGIGFIFTKIMWSPCSRRNKRRKKGDLWLCHSNYFFTNNVGLLNYITGQFLFFWWYLYRFPQVFIRHTCNFSSLFSLYVYRKKFLYSVYFFGNFSLDQLYSISHVQFINIVFYLNK